MNICWIIAVANDAASQPMTQGEAFLQKLAQGGWTMLFLLALSIYAIAVTLERLVHLRRKWIVPVGLVDKINEKWAKGDFSGAIALGRQSRSTLGRLLAAITELRGMPLKEVQELTADDPVRELRHHLQRAYPLAVVATLSPLLGLFGTVIGMIGAFDKVSLAGEMADPSLFGGDIAKALITTGAGLTVAMPALALYHYFRSRTNNLALMMEHDTAAFLKRWFGPAANASAQAAAATRSDLPVDGREPAARPKVSNAEVSV